MYFKFDIIVVHSHILLFRPWKGCCVYSTVFRLPELLVSVVLLVPVC